MLSVGEQGSNVRVWEPRLGLCRELFDEPTRDGGGEETVTGGDDPNKDSGKNR